MRAQQRRGEPKRWARLCGLRKRRCIRPTCGSILFAILAVGSVQLPAGRAAASILVVDTGPGGGTHSLTPERWLAAQFTLDQAYTISSVRGWIAYTGPGYFAPIAVVIYGDGGDVPDTAEKFVDQQFGIGLDPLTSDWRGLGGLELHLAAGATSCIDQGVGLPAGLCDQDIDGDDRDANPDVGADEYR